MLNYSVIVPIINGGNQLVTQLNSFPDDVLPEKVFIIDNSCRNSPKNIDNHAYITYTDGYGFSFNLPEECEVLSKHDLENIRELDPTITFMALTGLPFVCSTVSISVYDLHQETILDSAFIKTVKHIPTQPVGDTTWNYRLIDYGIQMVDNKPLRYKISCIDSTDYYIMYYFMKNDKSNILYEIKATCYSENEIKTAKDFIEEIALTASFISK